MQLKFIIVVMKIMLIKNTELNPKWDRNANASNDKRAIEKEKENVILKFDV